MAATLVALLEDEGYTAASAADATAAIEAAGAFGPAAMVLDIGMPGGGGLAVARWVRRQPWGRRTLLIAASGWAREEDRASTVDAGFDIHLTKPVQATTLLDAIHAGLGPPQRALSEPLCRGADETTGGEAHGARVGVPMTPLALSSAAEGRLPTLRDAGAARAQA